LALERAVKSGDETDGKSRTDRLVEAELQALLAEFNGEVEEDTEGVVRYRFPSIFSQFKGAEKIRRQLKLEDQVIGDIVYASDQTDEEAHERDLAAFDRELEGGEDLTRFLLAPERIGYLDDLDLIAFD
jgi:hypothetical protein